MNAIRFRVDAFHPGRKLGRRTQVMDIIEARQVAYHDLKGGWELVEIVALDSTGPFVMATYQPASVPGLHTRPSKD